MLYVEYEQCKRDYHETHKQFKLILDEKERLFERTQPKAVRFDKDVISGGTVNLFEEYVSAKERSWVDERMNECRNILQDRKRLMDLKGAELRQSKEIHDRVYVMRYIDRRRINHIARMTNKSRATIFRVLDEIRKNLRV